MTSKRDHGDGGIDQRGPDRWRLRWRVGGKRYTKAFQGTKRAAQIELRRLLKSADDGQHVAPDKVTLAAWAARWLETCRVHARTLESYANTLRIHVLPVLGSRQLQQITPSDLDGLYLRLGGKLSPGSVGLIHGVVRSCLGAAVRKGLLLNNPASRAERLPKAEETGCVLDPDEVAALLAGFRRTSLYPIVATALFTGARRNELLALRWADVNLSTRTITIARSLEVTKAYGVRFKEPKTKRGRRTFAIDAQLADLLAAERERYLRLIAGIGDGASVNLDLIRLPEDALVFPSSPLDLTQPRSPTALTGAFFKITRKLGLKLRFHDLRGTHETMLLDAGVPVHVVAARCGHDPAVMLRIYAKRTKQADTQAADVLGGLWVQLGSKRS